MPPRMPAGRAALYTVSMTATTVDSPQPSFATSAELAALRAEVAELRRQVSDLQAGGARSGAQQVGGGPVPPDWRRAMANLQAGYDALSDEAKAIHRES